MIEVPGYLQTGDDLHTATAVQQYVANHIEYRHDPPGLDSWSRPEYTLAVGFGDCEDHAILKFAMLRQLGFAAEDLSLTYGFCQGQAHLVLTVKSLNLVLDVSSMYPVEDMNMDVKAYSSGTQPDYETLAWNNDAVEHWRYKIAASLFDYV